MPSRSADASATSKRYTDRLKEAQTKTGEQDAIVVAQRPIGGMPTVVAAFNFDFMGGSMGVGRRRGAGRRRRARGRRNSAALIVVPASGGARMQEGILSLMQMPRTVIAVDAVKEAGLPYIVVLTDPTTGGVTPPSRCWATSRSPSPARMIGFAGARVIEETIREKLPEGFQRAEYLLEHGMVDMVVRARTAARAVADHRPPDRSRARRRRSWPVAAPAWRAGTTIHDAAACARRPNRGWSAEPTMTTRYDERRTLRTPATSRWSASCGCIRRSSTSRSTGCSGCSTALGNPDRRLPPVVHVAGTNGKGSTVAYLRAILEAAGKRVHVYTSPHLVRFHERIRLAGKLIEEGRWSTCRGVRAGQWRRADHLLRDHDRGGVPRLRAHAGRYRCCWKPALAAGSTRPT